MLHIAICGAGPVGLTLARLLLPYTSHNTSTATSPRLRLTIFEKDLSPTSRTSPGGTLDLHPQTGLAAMKAMALWDAFLAHARFEGEELRIYDCNGTVYFHQTGQPQIRGFESRPEIDRVRLMEVLLGGVPGEMVRWGRGVKGVVEEEGGMGRWKVEFEDGVVEGPFDLVVGADGAWSKVREALTEVRPGYAGVCGVSGTIDMESAGEKWKGISDMVGKGSNFSFSYGRSAMLQRLGDGTLKCAFYQRREMKWIQDLRMKHERDDEALRLVLLEEYKDWASEFHQWITSAKELWCMPLYELPVGHSFEHRAGLTLIGDSSHLMTPFAGEGVNAGMRDALDLSAAIVKVLKGEELNLSTAVAEFEQSMFRSAAHFMADTMINKTGMFAQDAPYSFFVAMLDVGAREMGHDTKRGWLSWVLMPVRPMIYALLWAYGTFGAMRRKVKDAFRRRRSYNLAL